MKKLFFLGFLSFSTWNTSAQTYFVPGAQVQPAWVFPLWFEDGSGVKDTLYFCYDPNAQYAIPYDTLFGEKEIAIDTSRFNVYYDCSFNYSLLLVRKTFVTDTVQLGGQTLCVWKAYLPLKIKWDRNVFYNAELPYPDQLPAPKVKGGFGFDLPTVSLDPFPNCFSPLLMTDTVITANCYATDSIVLGGGFSIMEFGIGKWDGKEWQWGAVEAFDSVNNFQFYPSLFTTSFHLKNYDSKSKNFIVYDLVGSIIAQGKVLPYQTLSVGTENWNHGIYFLRISNENKSTIFKLLKPH